MSQYDGSINIDTRLDASGVDSGLQKMNGSMGKSMLAANLLSQAIGSIFSMITGSLDKAMARLDTMDQFNRVMSTMTGSADITADALNTITEAVAGTAYGLDAGAKAVQAFVSSGMTIGNATDTFEIWADAVSFYTQGTNAELETVTSALQKMGTKGTVSMEHLQMLLEAGIPAIELYADAVGISTSEVTDQMGKGELKTSDFIKAMNQAYKDGTSKFPAIAGAAKEAGSSWNGSIDNMKAAITRGVASILTSFEKMFKVKANMVKFGKSIEQVLKFVGQNLNWLIPIIGGVIAAIIAFQIAGVIAAGVVKEAFLNAFKAIASNPIGAVIAAITIAIAAVMAWISYLTQASDEMEQIASDSAELVEKNKEVVDSVKDIDKGYAESTANAERYISTVEKLAGKTDLTASEQYQLQYAMNQLNEAYPGLNLSIENCANGLDQQAKNTIAVANQTSRYNAIAKKQEEIAAAIADAELEIALAKDQNAKETVDLGEADREAIQNYLDLTDASDGYVASSQEVYAAYQRLTPTQREYINGEEVLKEVTDEQTASIEELTAQQEALNTMYSESSLLLQQLGFDTETMTEAQIASTGEQMQAIVDVQTELEDLNTAYNTARDTALESIQKQTDKFKELDTEAGKTVGTVTDVTNKNTEALNNFSSNLETLRGKDIPGLQDMLGSLDLSTEENMANINEWATASDDDLQKMVEAWEAEKEAEENAAEQIALTQTDYESAYNDIVDAAEDAIQGLNLSGEAYEAGKATAQGLINAVNDSKSNVNYAFQRMATDAINTMYSTLSINSPSKVFRKIGEFTIAGFVQGVEKSQPSVDTALRNSVGRSTIGKLTENLKAGFSANQRSASMAIGNGFALAGATVEGGYTSNFTQVINSPVALSPSELTQEATDAMRRQKWKLP